MRWGTGMRLWAVLAVGALALSGCASAAASAGGTTGSGLAGSGSGVAAVGGPSAPAPSAGTAPVSGPVAVVASTNVWASVAQAVGGDDVHVTAFIADPNTDPHDYQATARNRLALSRAALVIENGGGYDDFMRILLDATPSPAPVINAAEVSGDAGPDVNEHIWYDLPAVVRVANDIAGKLSAADPGHAKEFHANATAFAARVHALTLREAGIKAAHGGDSVAITEPLPLYMLQACGLQNATPQAFSKAVEDGTDVPPLVFKKTLDLVRSHRIAALVYNAQTADTQTALVLAAARDAGVPAVPVTETLPAGKDYLSWMSGNLDALEAALVK